MKLTAGIAVVALALLGVLWFALRPERANVAEPAAAPAPKMAPADPREHTAEMARLEGELTDAPVRAATTAPESTREQAAAPTDGKVVLVGELRNGSGANFTADEIAAFRIVLRQSAAVVECSCEAGAPQFRSAPLDRRVWDVEITGSTIHPLRTRVDITRATSEVAQVFTVYPMSRWLLVRATTRDRAPYTEIARELGLEVEDVFEAGFRLWVADTAPADPEAMPELPPTQEFHVEFTSPHYDSNYDLSVVARVQRSWKQVVWVGLAFHDAFLGWGEAPPELDELEFTLTADDVRSQFASLALRVVDVKTQLPIDAAHAHLDAEVSGLRRADTNDVAVDGDGRAEFKPLIPGEYDLLVGAPDHSELRQRVVLTAGQRLDLGNLGLDFAPPIEIHVVDEAGQPMRAILQLGPYRKGVSIEDCVSPRAWATNSDGSERVPAPSVPTVVRAQAGAFGEVERYREVAFAVLDPERLPPRVEMVIRKPLERKLSAPSLPDGATRAKILNELEIVIDEPRVNARAVRVSLAPGHYRALFLNNVGAEFASYEFDVVTGEPGSEIVLR